MKLNAKSLSILLLLSLCVSCVLVLFGLLSGCATDRNNRETSINPKLIKIYQRMVAYEDNLPKAVYEQDDGGPGSLALAGYMYQIQDDLFRLEHEFARLIGNPQISLTGCVGKECDIVYYLQKHYGATSWSILLVSERQGRPAEETNRAQRKYIPDHPEIRFTEMAKLSFLGHLDRRRGATEKRK
jgi:hypothetical protein